jgi:hypothetical protein
LTLLLGLGAFDSDMIVVMIVDAPFVRRSVENDGYQERQLSRKLSCVM